MNRGGKIITPIREAMSSGSIDGVIFQCNSRINAEKTRISSIVTKHRLNLDYRTHVDRDNSLIVYKKGIDLYDEVPNNYIVQDLRN